VKLDNIFSKVPYFMQDEVCETLLMSTDFKLERIVSSGQATPPGKWFDESTNEWVILLCGSAGLRFANEEEGCVMYPGDYVHIPAHKRHRVEWTDPEQKTVWLALHYGQEKML
jgi:cupin 2 domain-containing protein